MEKTTLQRIDEESTGRFNNGDVYLVMHANYDLATSGAGGASDGSAPPTSSALTRTLFYWVGSKASMDKGTVACIKAVELRRALSGPCSIQREDEGRESPEFLVLFDEVVVAEEESGARVLSKVIFFGKRGVGGEIFSFVLFVGFLSSGFAFMEGRRGRRGRYSKCVTVSSGIDPLDVL